MDSGSQISLESGPPRLPHLPPPRTRELNWLIGILETWSPHCPACLWRFLKEEERALGTQGVRLPLLPSTVRLRAHPALLDGSVNSCENPPVFLTTVCLLNKGHINANARCRRAVKPPRTPSSAWKDGHTCRERHSGCPAGAPTRPGCGVGRMVCFPSEVVSVLPSVHRERRREEETPGPKTLKRQREGATGAGTRPFHPSAWFRGCRRLHFISFPLISVLGPLFSSCIWFPWYNYLLSLNCLSFQSAYFVLLQKYTFLAKVMEFAAK